jgi:tetratricopeptide (TPR) repeat protein
MPAAISTLERAHALAESGTVVIYAPSVRGELARAYALAGRFEQSLALVERISTSEEPGSATLHWTLSASEAYLMAGRVTDALMLARRGLERTRRAIRRGFEAWALRLVADASSHGDSSEMAAAADHYHRALDLAQQLGMRPLVAHCHLGLGTLYQGTSDQAKAAEHRQTATTMYREMGMVFWLEKAKAVRS